MFTGIVQAVGTIEHMQPVGEGARMVVNAPAMDCSDVRVGDSLAVNGCCLTAVQVHEHGFEADVSRATLACTVGFAPRAQVNLEKALRLADRLGGHLVSGHVDGTGEILRMVPAGDNRELAIRAPAELACYLARKGSITINGVSLTINDVEGQDFRLNLIPHTLQATNLGRLAAGDRVNLEVDLLARYVERLLAARVENGQS